MLLHYYKTRTCYFHVHLFIYFFMTKKKFVELKHEVLHFYIKMPNFDWLNNLYWHEFVHIRLKYIFRLDILIKFIYILIIE